MKLKGITKMYLSGLLLGFLFSISLMQHADAFTITQLTVDDSQDFVVEPGKTELFLNPGETVTRTISVTNRTNRKVDFEVGVENMKGNSESGNAVTLLPVDQETPYPLHEYINFELDKFSLNFGEKITFDVTITTPSNIEPGGHYGAIIISTKSPRQFDANGNEVRGGAQLTSRIGSLVLMRINGDANESGHLDTFKVSGPKKLFYQTLPTSFEIAYQNDGSVHLVPYGDIVIKNLFGAQIAQIPVDAYFVLPDSIRYQTITWPGKSFSFGFYRAELNLYKGYGDEFDTAKSAFFVIPLIIILPVIIIFLIVFSIVYFVSKRYEFKRK